MITRLLPYLFIIGIVILIIYLNNRSLKRDPKFIKVPLPGDRKAVTMPPFGVYIEPDVAKDPSVIKHEMCHWDQYQDKGLIDFYREYFHLKANNDYQNNPMEQECFIAEKS